MLKQPSECGEQGQRWRWPCTMDALSQILWSMPSICLDMSFFRVQHVQSKLFTDYFICRLIVMLLPHTAAPHQKKSGPKRGKCYPQRPGKLDVGGSNKIKYSMRFFNMQSWIYVLYVLFIDTRISKSDSKVNSRKSLRMPLPGP